jgi:hypothetical protein
LFRGVLSIHSLAHLSEKGQEFVNNDFKERVMRSALNGVQSARKLASLDLEAIFVQKAKRQTDVPEAERYNVRVLIQGFMRSTASFMRCESCLFFFICSSTLPDTFIIIADLAPDGLLFHTTK